ncbi:hypothetical protein TL16_g05832 [Triparma laevis f. inornata]|uniref:Uncharacterized protein n=1 Tax=Triparma laevis f. inornata TaxID=1714386 RepID=A0A9W7AG13_9STRA|nr:hypothetical protein TL16_g05832 [Triparma laevis f. inornata]
MPLIGQGTLDEYQFKLDALNATPQRDRTLALMQSPDENLLYEKEENRKENLKKKKKKGIGGGSHTSHDIEMGRRGSKDQGHHHHGGGRRGSKDRSPNHSPRRDSHHPNHHDTSEPHPNAHHDNKSRRKSSSSKSTSTKGDKLKPLKKKGSFGLGGLISEISWNSFLTKHIKDAKIAPKAGADASTPFDIHDMHGKTDAEKNSDGDYFTQDAKKAGVGSKFIRPKFGFFGLIGYMMYYFFKDTALFSTQFFFLVALGMSMTICIYNLYSKGWNIFEMLGGRRGGSGG